MKINLIAAIDQQGAIGYQGRLPWPHLPEDLKRFKQLTEGATVVCGRKTYESLPTPPMGKPKLAGRNIIVLSRDINATRSIPHNVAVCANATHALMHAIDTGCRELFVIGGSNVYREFMPIAEYLYLTLVGGVYPADTWFPPVASSRWSSTFEARIPARDATPSQTFITLQQGY